MDTRSEDAHQSNGFGGVEPEEIEIPVPWGHVSGKWWGSKTTQPIVALHGRQDNAGSFDTLMPLLCRDHSFLCLDMPGHGRSSHLPKGQYYYVHWDGVMLLRRVVKYFQWCKLKIIGHSLGGCIGFLYAATFPDDVGALISLDIATPAVRSVEKIVEATARNIDRYFKYEHLSSDDVPCYDYEEMIDTVVDAYHGGITRDSACVMMKRGMQPAPEPGKYLYSRDARLKVSMLGMMSRDLAEAYAEQITCPYLNIRANGGIEHDYPTHYEEIMEIIKRSSRKFEYHEVEGTHHVHLNEPEKVAPIIANFLESLDDD